MVPSTRKKTRHAADAGEERSRKKNRVVTAPAVVTGDKGALKETSAANLEPWDRAFSLAQMERLVEVPRQDIVLSAMINPETRGIFLKTGSEVPFQRVLKNCKTCSISHCKTKLREFHVTPSARTEREHEAHLTGVDPNKQEGENESTSAGDESMIVESASAEDESAAGATLPPCSPIAPKSKGMIFETKDPESPMVLSNQTDAEESFVCINDNDTNQPSEPHPSLDNVALPPAKCAEEHENLLFDVTSNLKRVTISEPDSNQKAGKSNSNKNSVGQARSSPIQDLSNSPIDQSHSFAKPKASIAARLFPLRSTMSKTPPRTPPRTSSSSDNTPSHVPKTEAPSVSSFSGDGNEHLGSESNPHIDHINLDFPERNRTLCVEQVDSMERNNWSRPGLHLSKHVCMLDFELWTLAVPQPDSFPEFAGRCLLLRHPSRDWCQRNEHCQKNVGKRCPNTKKAIDATDIAIQQDASRQWVHCLLVSPHEIENNHFGHGCELTRCTNGIKLGHSETGNTFKKDIRSMHVCWEIAFKVGGKPLKDEKKTAVKHEDLVD